MRLISTRESHVWCGQSEDSMQGMRSLAWLTCPDAKQTWRTVGRGRGERGHHEWGTTKEWREESVASPVLCKRDARRRQEDGFDRKCSSKQGEEPQKWMVAWLFSPFARVSFFCRRCTGPGLHRMSAVSLHSSLLALVLLLQHPPLLNLALSRLLRFSCATTARVHPTPPLLLL